MGNKTSVTLNISLEGSVAKAGLPLTGKVVAFVRGKVPDGKLTLFVSGKESTFIHNHLVSGRTKKSDKKWKTRRGGERQFLSVSLILHDAAKRKLKAGNYYFPFSILLPECLPTTTSLTGSRSGFEIAYEIKAQIGKFHTNKPFTVESAPLPPDKVPCMLRPTTHEVRQLGLLKKGFLTLAASVEDTHVGRGGVLEVALACRNAATVNIQRVQVKVVELLHWKTGEDGEDRSATEKRVLVDLNDIDLPGLFKVRKDRSEIGNGINNGDHQEIFEDLRSGYNMIRLNIPPGTRDTHKGQLVDISHYIKIKLVTNSLTDCPFAKIPLKIGFPSNASPATLASFPISIPSNNAEWQPPTQQVQGDVVEVPGAQIGNDQTCYDIPIVDAILVNEDGTYVLSSPVHASPEAITVGGSARMLALSDEDEIDLAALTPVPPPGSTPLPIPLPPPTVPSLSRLLEDIAASVNDFELISQRLNDCHWKSVFTSLSSTDFGTIIRRVNVEFDQPRIAELLAPHVNGESNFNCEYAAAAVRNTSEWNRATMAQRLLPFCVDLSANHHLILNELQEWERVVTRRHFELAIARCY